MEGFDLILINNFKLVLFVPIPIQWSSSTKANYKIYYTLNIIQELILYPRLIMTYIQTHTTENFFVDHLQILKLTGRFMPYISSDVLISLEMTVHNSKMHSKMVYTCLRNWSHIYWQTISLSCNNHRQCYK